MKLMRYEEFEEYVKQNLKILLPESFQDAEISVREVRKPGYTYHGMALTRLEQRFGVIVDLDYYYRMYRRPIPISKILFSIASLIQENVPDIDVENITDYEWTAARLFVRVFNRMWSRDYLRHVPHQAVEDLAVTPHVLLGINGTQISSTPVTYDLLSGYGIPASKLFEDAVNNSTCLFPAELRYLADYLGAERSERRERIITNGYGINGAASLFYPGQMDAIAEEVGDDFYAVPTSIHEMIIVPASVSSDEDEMNRALYRTISEFTDERDWLSDHIYYYDSGHRVFTSVRTEDFSGPEEVN